MHPLEVVFHKSNWQGQRPVLDDFVKKHVLFDNEKLSRVFKKTGFEDRARQEQTPQDAGRENCSTQHVLNSTSALFAHS
jgi:hypothetical protein